MFSGSQRLAKLLSMTNQIAGQLQGLHFTGLPVSQVLWEPAINVYEHQDCLEVCMDLAGVDKRDIRVRVDRRRLTISGRRAFPESRLGGAACGRILVMEIPDGEFERTLQFAADINPDRVEARQDNGWLWIVLPKGGEGEET